MRRNVIVKICLCILSLTLFLLWYNVYRRPISDTRSIVFVNITQKLEELLTIKSPKLKYILQWTSPVDVPFVYMDVGQNRFFKNKCKFTNCYVTGNRYHLKDYTQFDVIVFAGPEVISMYSNSMPPKRSVHQKYVFASIESSHNYPLCSNRYDNFFNWTWTYRLDSENRWGYIVVRDKQNKIIGPNKVMHWMKLEDMEPVSEDFKKSLKSKTTAAAWFVSNCQSRSRREVFVTELITELLKYKLNVDIYGKCGSFTCPRGDYEKNCEEMIKTKYYFYLSFENSFSEDYVTEKLLHGLQNNAIPIVYGGANYTRFMPEGIYLDARELGPAKLASKMNELIKDPDKYAEYFRWTNHYTFHRRNSNPETDDYCGMCALLNNEEMMKKKSVYKNLRNWWDSPKYC